MAIATKQNRLLIWAAIFPSETNRASRFRGQNEIIADSKLGDRGHGILEGSRFVGLQLYRLAAGGSRERLDARQFYGPLYPHNRIDATVKRRAG
jgi:hypothetical protein